MNKEKGKEERERGRGTKEGRKDGLSFPFFPLYPQFMYINHAKVESGTLFLIIVQLLIWGRSDCSGVKKLVALPENLGLIFNAYTASHNRL